MIKGLFNMKKIFSLLLAFALTLGALGIAAGASEGDNTGLSAPGGYVPSEGEAELLQRSLRSLMELPQILLIEDVMPWSNNAHYQVIQMAGELTKVRSNQVSSTDLSLYDLVIFSNDQVASTYQNYYSGFSGQLDEYVMNGGTLLFGAAEWGWNSSGEVPDYALPGGAVKVGHTFSDKFFTDSYISDFSHPIITGELTGNAPLTNEDFYGYGVVSYVYFDESTIPGGSVIVRGANGYPALIEYTHGAGTVIANGLGWEYSMRAYGPNGGTYSRNLTDLYAYALSVSSGGFQYIINSATALPGEVVEIVVGVKDNPGVAGFSFELVFPNAGGFITPVSIARASGYYSANGAVTHIFSNIDDPDVDWATTNIITAVWGSHENYNSSSDIFVIHFRVSEDAPEGVYPLDMFGLVVDDEYVELEHAVRAGKITVIDPEALRGDVMSDGIVDVKDLVKYMRFLVDLAEFSTLYEKMASNITGNNTQNNEDLIILAKYLANFTDVRNAWVEVVTR